MSYLCIDFLGESITNGELFVVYESRLSIMAVDFFSYLCMVNKTTLCAT